MFFSLSPETTAVLRASVSDWALSPDDIHTRINLSMKDTLANLSDLHVLGFMEEHAPPFPYNRPPYDHRHWYKASQEGRRYLGPTRGVTTETSDHGHNLLVALTEADLHLLVEMPDACVRLLVKPPHGTVAGYDYVEIRLGAE
jgi:hypothetical protein